LRAVVAAVPAFGLVNAPGTVVLGATIFLLSAFGFLAPKAVVRSLGWE
jgi:hypothetical protein